LFLLCIPLSLLKLCDAFFPDSLPIFLGVHDIINYQIFFIIEIISAILFIICGKFSPCFIKTNSLGIYVLQPLYSWKNQLLKPLFFGSFGVLGVILLGFLPYVRSHLLYIVWFVGANMLFHYSGYYFESSVGSTSKEIEDLAKLRYTFKKL